MSNEFVLNDKLYRDVTSITEINCHDEEIASLIKCVCNETFKNWKKTLSIYPEDAIECMTCKRKLHIKVIVKVYEEIGPAK